MEAGTPSPSASRATLTYCPSLKWRMPTRKIFSPPFWAVGWVSLGQVLKSVEYLHELLKIKTSSDRNMSKKEPGSKSGTQGNKVDKECKV